MIFFCDVKGLLRIFADVLCLLKGGFGFGERGGKTVKRGLLILGYGSALLGFLA